MKGSAGFFLALLFFSCHAPDPILWRLHLQNRSYAKPIIDENRIYIVSSAGEVICVSNSDGKILWSKRLDSPIVAAPAYSERSLFVGTQNGTLVSFDKKNGTEFWHKHFDDGFEAPLSVTANLLLAPSTAGKLYALAQSDGQSAWTHNGTGKYSAAALVSGSHIFIGSWKGDFFCIREDGKEEWRFKAAAGIVDTASVFQNIVCVPTHGAMLYALDSPSGRLLWRFSVTYPTAVVILHDSAFFGSGNQIFQIHVQDGRLLRKLDIGKTILSISPASHGCFVITDRIHEIDPAGRVRLIAGIPRGQKPFKIVETRFCYTVDDDLYSVLCIRK